MEQTNKSKYWVTMTDRFLSNWKYTTSENKTSKYVIECDSYQEALIVADNAEHRTEMKYVNISANKPYYNKNNYVVDYVDKNEASAFFRPGYFAKVAIEKVY